MAAGRGISALSVGLLLFFVGSAGAYASESHAPRKKILRHRHRPPVEVKITVTPKIPKPKEDGSTTTVVFTVLPGDTHAKLAADLTGEDGNQDALRRIDPTLKPGEKIKIPAGILLPGLADPHRETLVFGGKYPTLWSLARQTQHAGSSSEVGRTARNLQRLNAILSADRLAPGTKILVPKSWLAIGEARPAIARPTPPQAPEEEVTQEDPAPEDSLAAEAEAEEGPEPVQATVQPDPVREDRPAAPFTIHRQYVVKDLDGLDRKTARLPSRLRQLLSEREFEQAHFGRGEINLVVVHTTEHRGSTFENTASYIRRKRLANYVIGPDGAAYEVVPEGYRAYGCGDSVWEGRYYVDLEAINIEVFANTDRGPHQSPISDAQYEGLRALLADIRARRPKIDEGRVVTHRMVALNFKTGMRSRKGDPFDFHWGKTGLPDNSLVADRDLLDGRAKICTDCRFTDRVTAGQTEALKALKKL